MNLKKTEFYKYFDKRANQGIDPEKLSARKIVWWSCEVSPEHKWKQRYQYYQQEQEQDKFCPFCLGKKRRATIT